MKKQLYKVAEHVFSLMALEDNPIWGCLDAYRPFEIKDFSGDLSLAVNLVHKLDDVEEAVLLWSDDHTKSETTIDVYKCGDRYLFKIFAPDSDVSNLEMCVSADYSSVNITMHGSASDVLPAFYTAMMLSYTLSVSNKDTLLTHSSAIMYGGKAYLFHAKSGTGKSTHSGLWRRYIDGAVSLNDDHPVLRVSQDGTVMAYGSPWSGKTPVYLNASAPLGAMVRIIQAPVNEVRRLSVIEAYASLSTSCNSMTWERKLMDGAHRTLEYIATHIGCYKLSCRPDEEAVRVCYDAVIEGIQS